jgi:hypothetical protein
MTVKSGAGRPAQAVSICQSPSGSWRPAARSRRSGSWTASSPGSSRCRADPAHAWCTRDGVSDQQKRSTSITPALTASASCTGTCRVASDRSSPLMHQKLVEKRPVRFHGISPVRSHRRQDDSSTRASSAASLIDKANRRRYQRIRSASVVGSGDGSKPMNRMMAGMSDAGGAVLFFSQTPIVSALTPICCATSCCRSWRSLHRSRMCPPRIVGMGSARGAGASRTTFVSGKRATRSCLAAISARR